jgi:hypothetical protein
MGFPKSFSRKCGSNLAQETGYPEELSSIQFQENYI